MLSVDAAGAASIMDATSEQGTGTNGGEGRPALDVRMKGKVEAVNQLYQFAWRISTV